MSQMQKSIDKFSRKKVRAQTNSHTHNTAQNTLSQNKINAYS